MIQKCQIFGVTKKMTPNFKKVFSLTLQTFPAKFRLHCLL